MVVGSLFGRTLEVLLYAKSCLWHRDVEERGEVAPIDSALPAQSEVKEFQAAVLAPARNGLAQATVGLGRGVFLRAWPHGSKGLIYIPILLTLTCPYSVRQDLEASDEDERHFWIAAG